MKAKTQNTQTAKNITILNYIVNELENHFNELNTGAKETTKENKEKQNEILELIDYVSQTIKNK